MLNLNEIKAKNYEIIWFDGTKIELRKPPQSLFEKLLEVSAYDDDDIEELFNIMYDILFETFNNNVNGRKFTMEEIKENFDLGTAFIFIEDYLGSILPGLGK